MASVASSSATPADAAASSSSAAVPKIVGFIVVTSWRVSRLLEDCVCIPVCEAAAGIATSDRQLGNAHPR